MKIALCHFRVGETDGVSLEMDKWKLELENLGHNVIYLAGSKGKSNATIIPSLHYNHPLNNKIVSNSYNQLTDYETEEELKTEIFEFAKIIENELIKFINDNGIDLIIPNNILSLGWGLSAGIGFSKAIKKTNIKTLCHHHDFHWERELYSNPKAKFIKEILNKYFPPKASNICHICINNIAKNELQKRCEISAKVIPNVFDFSMKESFEKDEFNKDLRSKMGILENDIVFLQATRVVERKAIELAIDVIKEFQDNRQSFVGKQLYSGNTFTENNKIYLVLAGEVESDDYYQKLLNYAKTKKVNIININSFISHQRNNQNTNKIYSLWDAYSIADIITYPSILEGWGNQFLECLVAKKPVIIYEYPVYITDIKQFSFNIISLGDNYKKTSNDLIKVKEIIVKNTYRKILLYLFDKNFRDIKLNENFLIGKKNLSIESLKNKLSKII